MTSHGAPTHRSQRATLQVDGSEFVERCQADKIARRRAEFDRGKTQAKYLRDEVRATRRDDDPTES